MTFDEYLKQPNSKKITICEIDTPLFATWINCGPGIWKARLTPTSTLFVDDYGVTGYWGNKNDEYFNIQSFNIDGELYSEVASSALCISTDKSWYYDTATTDIYLHLSAGEPPCMFTIISPGAVKGFTLGEDRVNNNYYENIYYEPLIKSVPNLSKKKDDLFYGIMSFNGGRVSFINNKGYFDKFSQLGLYGQPIRLKLTFEGLPLSEAKLVFSGRVEDFRHTFAEFTVNIADQRKLLSRKLPINTFTAEVYPDMEEKLIGTHIPIAYGPVIKAPAYKTSSGNWTFADTEFNPIDSTIIVYNKDDSIFSHGGTVTDGSFTGADTNDKLTVSFCQSAKQNGLDVIADAVENYEGTAFSSLNYDLSEWESEKGSVKNIGIWIGKGKQKTTYDLIEQICKDNQGDFDVLADGRYTFRTLNPAKVPTHEIFQSELLKDPDAEYSAKQYLSSAQIEYQLDIKDKEYRTFINNDYQLEVYGKFRQFKERAFKSALTSEADAKALSVDIMDQSKDIKPKLKLKTKTQNLELRILDNVMYDYSRQSGDVVVGQSIYQVLGVALNLTSFELDVTIKQIKESAVTYKRLSGGKPGDKLKVFSGGTPSNRPINIIRGRSI